MLSNCYIQYSQLWYLSKNQLIRSLLEDLLHWGGDLPFPASLENELWRWNVLWHGKKQEHSDTPLPDKRSWQPNIHCLWHVVCLFLVLRLTGLFLFKQEVKCIWDLSEEQLSYLSVVAMHYCERLSADEVCQAFISTSKMTFRLFIVSTINYSKKTFWLFMFQ